MPLLKFMKNLTSKTQLLDTIDSDKTVVICFHTTRSAPSRRTMQLLTEAESQFPTAEFCKVDADADVFLPLLVDYDVVGLPTIAIFCDGHQAKTLVGDRGKKPLFKILGQYIKAEASPAGAPQKS